jgi:hypothetical protein
VLQLDLLVPPLRGPVVAGEQPHPVQTAEVAVDKRVARLRLFGRALGEAEMPGGVLLRIEEEFFATTRGNVSSRAAGCSPSRPAAGTKRSTFGSQANPERKQNTRRTHMRLPTISGWRTSSRATAPTTSSASVTGTATSDGSTSDACFKLKAHVSICVAVAFWWKCDEICAHASQNVSTTVAPTSRELSRRSRKRTDSPLKRSDRIGPVYAQKIQARAKSW